MKIIITLAFILIYNFSFAQTIEEYNQKISELNKKRTSLKTQIKSLNTDLSSLNNQIKSLEQHISDINPQFGSQSGIKAYISSDGGTLRETSNINGKIITTLKEGDVIYVTEEHNGLYLKVNFRGTIGFVNYNNIKSSTEIDKILTVKEAAKSKTSIISVDTNSSKYKRLSKLYGHDKAIKMCSKQLWKGMSMGQIKESVGVPVSSTKENTHVGIKETLNYSDRILVIINGSLSSWTNK